jgi:TonB family protein
MRRPLALVFLLCLGSGPSYAQGSPGMAQMVDSPALKAAFIQASVGEVELAIDVTEDGRVEHPRILRSSPPGVFDAAALDMMTGRHMRPVLKDGTPQAVHDHRIVLRFQADAEPPAMLQPEQ